MQTFIKVIAMSSTLNERLVNAGSVAVDEYYFTYLHTDQ